MKRETTKPIRYAFAGGRSAGGLRFRQVGAEA